MLEFDDVTSTPGAKIKVFGVGGGGGNAINTMIEEGLEGVEFIAANTDMQALERNRAPVKIQLGGTLTKGLGAGADPEIGRNAALEDQARIAEILDGADMVFVTAGMGGGTGTGAAPVIANLAREAGALTVGVMTKPFSFEGSRRRRVAEHGMAELQNSVDTLITIPNQRLLAIAGENTSIIDAFRKADEVLLHAVQGISDLITIGGYVNVDFADVKTIMSNMGLALMGTGRTSGPTRARDAAEMAISSPLLEDVSINGATGILINITGGPDLALFEINEASMLIQEAAHEEANIIFGAVIDENMREEIKITVIATGFDRAQQGLHLPQHYQQQQPQPQAQQNPWQQGRGSGVQPAPASYNQRPAYEVQRGYAPAQPQAHQPAAPTAHHAQNPQAYAPAPQPAARPLAPPSGHQPVRPAQPRATAPAPQPAAPQQHRQPAPVAQAQQPASGDWDNPFRQPHEVTAEQPQLSRSRQEHAAPAPSSSVGNPQIRRGTPRNSETRSASFTRPGQETTNAKQPAPSGRLRRSSNGGLSPVEEEELAIPTFLRNPKDRNR